MRPDGPRDPVAGPDSGPQDPFPIRLQGPIVKGFGRGSKELGIPTANLPIGGLSVGGHDDLESGVYYGWAGLQIDRDGQDSTTTPSTENNVYPMVMSLGWNPFYKNKVRSIEVHIIHKFERDFYGNHLNIAILGFIRPEYDYVSLDSLVEDINTDIDVTKQSLRRPAYDSLRHDSFLTSFAQETTLS